MNILRPLPRSLDPLSDESLPGYLLRLAHRLDLSPARVAVLTGLTDPQRPTIPASYLFALPPEHAETFARTTHMSLTEVTELTLVNLASRYPPLDLAFTGRNRQAHGILVKENWVFARASRYCPDCLAGHGSPIQHQHGGAWKRLWRLPVVFACCDHRRLLDHACPSCRQTAQHRAATQLLALAGRAGLHPTQCRTTRHTDTTRRRVSPCGARYDQRQPPSNLPGPADCFGFQAHLLGLLQPDGPDTTTSVGQPTSPARYLVDLRLMSCLITSSWPAARELVEDSSQAQVIDQHVQRIRNQITEIRRTGREVREIACYDKPPLESVAGALLLMLAHRLSTIGDADALRQLLRPLVADAPAGMPLWTRQFLAGDGYCSPGMRAALGLAIGSPHVMRTLGIQPRRPTPPPQAVRFGIDHIPQHLLPEWHAEYLAGFNGVKSHLVRRAAAARLAQICVGGPIAEAAELLGIPRHATTNAVTVVKHHLCGRARRAFDHAAHGLAEHLDNATRRTNYGHRRRALNHWSITEDEWTTLIADLPKQPTPGATRAHIDWGYSKRILASIWIWVRITQGEHIFAPPIRPNLDQPRPGGSTIRQIHSRWPLISAPQPTGHYTALRARLDIYADKLAAAIDRQLVNEQTGAVTTTACM